MNSQNPNPSEGQQPANASDDQPSSSEEQQPEPQAARPDEPPHAATPEPQTEPLLPPPLHNSHDLPGGHGAPGAPAFGTGYGRPPQQQNFFDWIRSHGIHRRRDRWIGGVSSGIAERMGIDPLIVRGIFIVLTLFAGIGVLLYGIGWALLPEPDERIHTQEAGAGRWTSGMTGALVTTVLGLTGMGGGFWGWGHDGFGFFWTLFWVGGLIYLVYFLTQRNKNRIGTAMNNTPAGSQPAYRYAASAGTPASDATATFAAGTQSGPTQYGTNPPSGPNLPYSPNPPYGTAGPGHIPSSYSGGFGSVPPRGPAPVPAPVPAPKSKPGGPGAPAVAITAGLALLVGGALKALDAGNVIELGNSANAVVWASGAAVLGLGILLAGFRGRTSGILGFFAVVALIIGGIFNVVPNGDRFRFQDADWNPTSIEQARQGFQITGGRGTVDLTGLGLKAPLPADVVIPMDVTASNVTVVIPSTVPVDVRADMTLGNLNEGAANRSGITSRQSSYNTDRPGARLILQIDGTVSNVTIQEGN
jgi:phage shock protein PspC (stress-responsive transcriptional regulator)